MSVLAAVAASFFAACSDDVCYSTDSRQVLSFTSDTISLDSVMAGVTSPSVRFMAYNRNDCALRFDVMLMGGSLSVFEMLADGVGGHAAAGLEVQAGDSVVFFLRARPELRTDAPSTGYVDSMRFILENGAVQYLPLKVTSLNARRLDSYHVHGTEQFDSSRPYLIFDSLYVPFGATLKIGPGTRLYFHDGAGLYVDGRMIAVGTDSGMVHFRGDRLDCVAGLPYDLVDGRWGGIRIGESSYGNRIEWCDIHGAQEGVVADSSDISKVKVDIVSSIVHNMTGNCLDFKGCLANVSNSQITNSGKSCLSVTGGETHLLFSTIADFSVWHMADVAVSIIDRLSDTDDRPFGGVSIDGCIITGRHQNELDISPGLKSDWAGRLSVSHSLIMTNDTLAAYFTNSVFEHRKSGQVYGAANFADSGNRYDCVFRLDSLSRARGIGGDRASECPVDLSGNPRPVEMPDAGCYQYVPIL